LFLPGHCLLPCCSANDFKLTPAFPQQQSWPPQTRLWTVPRQLRDVRSNPPRQCQSRFMGETWAQWQLRNAKTLISMVGAVGATDHLTGNADLA
jgi:hypothetical protein